MASGLLRHYCGSGLREVQVNCSLLPQAVSSYTCTSCGRRPCLLGAPLWRPSRLPLGPCSSFRSPCLLCGLVIVADCLSLLDCVFLRKSVSRLHVTVIAVTSVSRMDSFFVFVCCGRRPVLSIVASSLILYITIGHRCSLRPYLGIRCCTSCGRRPCLFCGFLWRFSCLPHVQYLVASGVFSISMCSPCGRRPYLSCDLVLPQCRQLLDSCSVAV